MVNTSPIVRFIIITIQLFCENISILIYKIIFQGFHKMILYICIYKIKLNLHDWDSIILYA